MSLQTIPPISIRRPRLGVLAVVAAGLIGIGLATPVAASPQDAPAPSGRVIVYLLDHQFLPPDEIEVVKREVARIFAEASLTLEWVADESPRRRLERNELRVIILPSDGTRWFHGPSNVIGIAPHDDTGIGRNCFVFYRQAIWFRQQATQRCYEAVRARAEADMRGDPVDPYLDALAPPDCGDKLPSLTARIVARAVAHEMVHILLNKLDHSDAGLMRLSFDINDWMVDDPAPFQLNQDEIDALQDLLALAAESPGEPAPRPSQ